MSEAEKYEDVANYVLKRKIPYPVLHDPGAVNAEAFGAGGTAHAFVIGRDGKVAWEGRCGPGQGQEACAAALKAALTPPSATKPGK